MKLIIFFFLSTILVLNIFGQCDSLKIDYQIDILKRESRMHERFFTNIPKDSLEINFEEGFGNIPVVVIIDGVQKYFNNPPIYSHGLTESFRFLRPESGSKIEIICNGVISFITYNGKYNVIRLWLSDCILTVCHTNRMILYE